MFSRFKYFFVMVFVFSLGLWARFSLFGFDGYATQYFIRRGVVGLLPWQPGALFLFGLFPDSLLFFKFVMFLSLLLSCWFLFLLVRKFFDERTAWLSIIVLFATTPWLLFEFAKFENELFAFPLILLGLYFLFCKKWYFFVPLVCSLPFWLWVGYFNPFFGSGVLELQLFAGLSTLFVGSFFLIPYFLQKSKWVVVLGLIFVGFCLWSSHLTVFVIPVVVLGIAKTIELISNSKYDIQNAMIPCVILILCLNIALFLSVPTDNEWKVLDKTVELHNDTNFMVYNDWSFGHWLRIKGIETKYRSGGNDPDYNSIEKPFIALTTKDMGYIFGCKKIQGFGSSTRNINLYKCD